MITEEIFVCGRGLLSHPVSNLFYFAPGAAQGAPTAADLDRRRLLLADCRLASAEEVTTWTSTGLAAGRPVLLLCPSVTDLAALGAAVRCLPELPPAALLIESAGSSGGLPQQSVRALGYTHLLAPSAAVSAPGRLAQRATPPARPAAAVECACTELESLGGAFVLPASADLFKVQVEQAMDLRTRRDESVLPPTGLKYFMVTQHYTMPFTYHGGGSNGAGNMTMTLTIWGFLSQTATANSQYLVVEGQYLLNPGSLISDTECGRGFGNANFSAAMQPGPTSMNPIGFGPTQGDGTFTGALNFPISYKNPLGGYGVWNFERSVTSSASSWACGSISSGASLGAKWWMTSPCNGSNLADTWHDAFTDFGHVGALTPASSGTLDVRSIGAWVTLTVLTGVRGLRVSPTWFGARLWGSVRSPGIYWNHNFAESSTAAATSFAIDFGPIQPG